MTDIVERLRDPFDTSSALYLEAADEIEALQAENNGLHAECVEREREIEALRAAVHRAERFIAELQESTDNQQAMVSDYYSGEFT